MNMNKISTWLWFETEAEEAAKFYASVFRNTELGEVERAPAGGEPHTTEGQVLVAVQAVGLNPVDVKTLAGPVPIRIAEKAGGFCMIVPI